MKKIVFILLILCLYFGSFEINAQVLTNVRPAEKLKEGEFSEWKKEEVIFDDGTKIFIEYRVGLVKRVVIGCHYLMEVKNTSNLKLTIKMEASYYDKLVKRHFSEEVKGTAKAGKIVSGKFIAQGCKKEKGVEKDDAGHCFACEFGINLYVNK